MKKNILVFPCGSEVGLEIYRSIAFSPHFNVCGGSSADDHGKYVFKNYTGNLPRVESAKFLAAINRVAVKKRIDFIIPAHDEVALKLSRAQKKGKLKTGLLTSPYETCRIAGSKTLTYEFFRGAIPVPRVFGKSSLVPESAFPVFIKPDRGQGTKGVYYKASNKKEADFYLARGKGLIITECLPGREYTVDCFTDRKGRLLYSAGRERKRISAGASVKTFFDSGKKFGKIAGIMNKMLKFRGAWFFQLKRDKKGNLNLMEFAPRAAGAMGISRCRGVNPVLLALFDAMNKDVEALRNKYTIEMDRALKNSYRLGIKYSHVYIDFDDVVVCRGKVNPQVMAFLYQCVNSRIKIHLLTKHRGSVKKELARLKMGGIFDEVIHLKNNAEKYKKIRNRKSIFIDDSFMERKKVSKKLKIPVFDTHMIESLMEEF